MSEPQYQDDDFVYVDPKLRKVVGLVEWKSEGVAKPLEMSESIHDHDDDDEPAEKGAKKKGKKKGGRKSYYPWGSYRSMKKLYKIEGKVKEVENYKTFDKALDLALNEPFWDE